MAGLAARIREAFDQWEPVLEPAIFGTTDPLLIEETVLHFVESRLGRVAETVFYRPGVGVVVGLRLDGRAGVVIKVHRWNVTSDRLAAVQRVQQKMVEIGQPAPEPLTGPEPLGDGIATIETLLDGFAVDGHSREVRRLLATGIVGFVSADIDPASVTELGHPLMLRPPGAPLWFEPHDLRFDFEATAGGAEWIDRLATAARSILDDCLNMDQVVGHFDWRVQNLGFADGKLSGIYDWDSLAIAPETVVVGNTAAIFSADWTHGSDPLPAVAEMRAFVADYEQARAHPFTSEERRIIDAANLFACAYGARCQHSDITLYPAIGHGVTAAWIRLLHERAEQTL